MYTHPRKRSAQPEWYRIRGGATKTRVLIAFEDEYRTYREFMASAVRMHRPRAKVVAAGLGRLGEKVTRFDPHLVICSRPNTVDLGGRPAWIELPPDPDKLAEICVDGQHSGATNPALEDLLSVLHETERLARTKRKLGDC